MNHSLVITSILLFTFSCSYCQRMDDSMQYKFYVNEQFQSGMVTFKTMQPTTALLNYSAFDQSVVFKKNGEVLMLTNPDDIDTIYMFNKKYVAFKKRFFEVVDNKNKAILLATYSYKKDFTPVTADHNGTHTENANSISNTITNSYVSRPYKADYSIIIEKNYFVRRFKKNSAVKTLNDWLSAFPESMSPKIRSYVYNNHINFAFEADLIALIDYCSGL